MANELAESDIFDMEREGCKGDTMLHQYVTRLVTEVRRLKHELADPNYSYSGRIHRHAIICRNEKIDALMDEVKKLKATN